jgi:hypothetical protein
MRSGIHAPSKSNSQLIQERMINLAGSEEVPNEFKLYLKHLEVLGINFFSYSFDPAYQTIIRSVGQQNATLNAQEIDQVILKMVQKLEEQWNKASNDQGAGKLRK